MFHLGRELGGGLHAGDLVAINGTLGAGKTVLCQGILSGLGYEGEVGSPSYAIVHHYGPPDVRMPVVHADLYRVNDVTELDELGLDDDAQNAVILIEWAERADRFFGEPAYVVDISILADGQREVEIRSNKNA